MSHFRAHYIQNRKLKKYWFIIYIPVTSSMGSFIHHNSHLNQFQRFNNLHTEQMFHWQCLEGSRSSAKSSTHTGEQLSPRVLSACHDLTLVNA
uniref:Uncharacterized protein n=1 Tax=Anguilla anguilla TaxID=7936 RepID=A0A0E9R5X5_ANGAN